MVEQPARTLHELQLRIDNAAVPRLATQTRPKASLFRRLGFTEKRNALALRPARRTRRAAIDLRRAHGEHKLPVKPSVSCYYCLPKFVVHFEMMIEHGCTQIYPLLAIKLSG
jgi:hypothetical protein